MTHQQILDFNANLIRTDSRYDIIEYIKQINNMYEKPIDLSFIEELMSFVEQNTCCIPHTLLVKYGAFKEKNSSQNVKERLDAYGYVDEIDYKLMDVHELGENNKTYHKKIYYLHPKTFKKMLMRSKCEDKYADYYLLLEESIKYYHDYQIMYKNNEITILSEKVADQSKQIQELINNNKITENRLTETEERVSDMEDEIEDTKDELHSTQIDLSIVQDKLNISVEDRAVKPMDKNKINRICILRSKEDSSMYYLTCGQKDSVARVIKRKSESHIVIDTICDVPNSIYLFSHIKNELNSNAKVSKRVIKLLRIEEEEFVDTIKSIFDGRRNIDLSKEP